MPSINNLFRSLKEIAPDDKLRRSILSRVETYQKTKIFKLRLTYYTTMAISLWAIIPVTQTVVQAFSQSNIYQFLSLIFTDVDIVIAEWQSFALSIVEALPIVEITALLFLTLLMIWAVNSINTIQFKNRLLQTKTI